MCTAGRTYFEQLGALEMAEHGLAPTISATEAQIHMPAHTAVGEDNGPSAFRLAVASSSLVAIAAVIVGFVRYAQ